MKDSRIGTYGAAALVLTLLMRVALLSRIGSEGIVALLLCPSLARLGPVWLLTCVEHAAPTDAKQKDFLAIGVSRALLATLSMFAVTAGMLIVQPERWAQLALAWFSAMLIAVYVGRLARRRLGGITGDLLGACEQLGEVSILAAFALRL